MNLALRRAGVSVATLLMTAVCAAPSLAQDYPVKTVSLVVPFPAGGPTDGMARVLAQRLSDTLGQQVVVENRGGAGGSIAAEYVARAAADGYTLFFGTTGTMAINPSLYKNLRYDPIKDFAPVSLMATTMNVLVVDPKLPAGTLPELIALAKDKPGALTYGSAGNGSSNHLSGELLRTSAGIQINHVPYKGSAPAMVDLLGGRLSMMFDTIAQQTQNIASGKVRGLVVTGPRRSPLLPDMPTAREAGLDDYDVTIWYGVLAPAGTPQAVVQRLQRDVASIMATDDMKQRMLEMGAQSRSTTPEEFADLIEEDTEKWAPVVKGSGASLD